jgi:hypothetical protein
VKAIDVALEALRTAKAAAAGPNLDVCLKAIIVAEEALAIGLDQMAGGKPIGWTSQFQLDAMRPGMAGLMAVSKHESGGPYDIALYVSPVQVPQNPFCWRVESKYSPGEAWHWIEHADGLKEYEGEPDFVVKALYLEPCAPVSGEIVAAAQELIARLQSDFKARNGKMMGIQADDGEKCFIIHSDYTYALECALTSSVDSSLIAVPREATEGMKDAYYEAQRGRFVELKPDEIWRVMYEAAGLPLKLGGKS